jgi:hypothetical protein
VQDGAGLERLGTEIIKLTGEVREMRGELKGFVDNKAHALQRVQVREETDRLIREAINALAEKTATARALEDQKTLEAARHYTDEQVAALVEELAAREDRDRRLEARVRASIWGVIGVGTMGVAFALYELFRSGSV